jgi:hypothetical protein
VKRPAIHIHGQAGLLRFWSGAHADTCRANGRRLGGWRPADKPLFDVQHLKHKLQGNNVPMPATLIKHILRVAIPGLIQRKLLGVLPKELGEYLLSGRRSARFSFCSVPGRPLHSSCSTPP